MRKVNSKKSAGVSITGLDELRKMLQELLRKVAIEEMNRIRPSGTYGSHVIDYGNRLETAEIILAENSTDELMLSGAFNACG